MTKISLIQTNGNGVSNYYKETNKIQNVRNFWNRLEFNEWTFSLLLFTFSLIIVITKLAVNFEYVNHWLFIDQSVVPSTLKSYQLPELDTKKIETITGNINTLVEKYEWIMRAVLSGVATIGFTWFIIYKDSYIPGINPSSPFRHSKNTFTKETGIPTNYLVGALNGLLIFFYMCF